MATNPIEPAGRLAAVRDLVAAALNGEPDLHTRLAKALPGWDLAPELVSRARAFHGEPSPEGLGGGMVAVWHDTGLFVVLSERPPMLSVDNREPVAMDALADGRYWYRVEQLDPGRLHLFRYRVDGEWAPGDDVAGYNPLSYELPGAPRGSLSDEWLVSSEIYPGATTGYRLYVNHGVDERRGAPLMVWHDGERLTEPWDLFRFRMQIVTDNLVHLGLIPPMVHVLVKPSTGGEGSPMNLGESYGSTMRSIQYDTFSERYGQHITGEVLPHAGELVKLRTDAYSRAAAGGSSGALSAFKLAWFQPDEFSRVHSVIGSFTGIQWDEERDLVPGFMVPHLVRREPRRNIRVWLSDGLNDLELKDDRSARIFAAGSWPLNNIMLANALKGRGYDFRFRFGEGYHNHGQGALDLPESLAWIWRDYDAERTHQDYEQDPAEQAEPMFRVSVVNRETR
jgi:enterochelin esterase-like enzyme